MMGWISNLRVLGAVLLPLALCWVAVQVWDVDFEVVEAIGSEFWLGVPVEAGFFMVLGSLVIAPLLVGRRRIEGLTPQGEDGGGLEVLLLTASTCCTGLIAGVSVPILLEILAATAPKVEWIKAGMESLAAASKPVILCFPIYVGGWIRVMGYLWGFTPWLIPPFLIACCILPVKVLEAAEHVAGWVKHGRMKPERVEAEQAGGFTGAVASAGVDAAKPPQTGGFRPEPSMGYGYGSGGFTGRSATVSRPAGSRLVVVLDKGDWEEEIDVDATIQRYLEKYRNVRAEVERLRSEGKVDRGRLSYMRGVESVLARLNLIKQEVAEGKTCGVIDGIGWRVKGTPKPSTSKMSRKKPGGRRKSGRKPRRVRREADTQMRVEKPSVEEITLQRFERKVKREDQTRYIV